MKTSTIRGYKADFRDFSEFCERHGFTALPASPETVCAYLAQLADSGKLKTGSIQRRVSAIADAHRGAGLDSPTAKSTVWKCISDIRRKLGTRQEGKAPTLTADLAAMLSHLPSGLIGIRDRALLLVGFAGAFRRSELVALEIEDVFFSDYGAKVRIRDSERTVSLLRSSRLCPVKALRAWISIAGITSGPIFRGVNRHGHLQPGAVTDQVVATVVKRYAALAGLDPRKYAGHSLRVGMVADATADVRSALLDLAKRTGYSPEMIAKIALSIVEASHA